MLRYKVDETDDGLSGEEGTFLICSFWLDSARFTHLGLINAVMHLIAQEEANV